MNWLYVAIGGALGSVLRYKTSGFLVRSYPNLKFPIGTFAVNIIGCLVIGVIAGLIIKKDLLSNEARLFIITGVIGGFTTFSAFGLDTFYLLRTGENLVAISYVLGSVLLGFLALYIGFLFVR
jgi:fluoride exporter